MRAKSVPHEAGGGSRVDTGFITLMRKLAPDLTEEMTRRALILERISVLQPVGRRQLAARLNLPEREIRNTAVLLKDLGYIELDASGMTLSRKAEEILDSARDFSKAMNGLTETENRLSELLPVERVLIAPGDADEDGQVLSDVGRICAVRLRALLQNGNTLAVTGGSTVAAVARSIQSQTPLNVMVVPARGGIGRSVELQANTLAEEIAGRLGGHYRLIHLPDIMDAAAMQEIHGVGIASETMKNRNMDRATQQELLQRGAEGESFGAYYDREGNCLMESSSVGVDLARLKRTCRMVAAAAGSSKAAAILSVLRHTPHALLVTDQGAAEKMLRILGGQ